MSIPFFVVMGKTEWGSGLIQKGTHTVSVLIKRLLINSTFDPSLFQLQQREEDYRSNQGNLR